MNRRPDEAPPVLDKATLIWLVVILLAGALTSVWMASEVDKGMRVDLLSEAERLADSINPQRIAVLGGTEADLERAEYQRLKDQLQSVRAAFPRYRFVYLMVQRPDQSVIFQVDSEPPGSEDESPPGDVYEEIRAEELQVFTPGVGLTTKPSEDRWGVWVSALTPISMPAEWPGKLALGIDIDAGDWRRQVFIRGILPVGLAILALLLITVTARVLILRRASSKSYEAGPLSQIELVLVLSIGLVLTATSTWIAHDQSQRFQTRAFNLVADAAAQGISQDLRNLRDFGLGALVRFFEASRHVTLEEFDHFTSHLIDSGLSRYWAWAPQVPAADREAFVELERALSRADFDIWGADTSEERERDWLFPITHHASLEAGAPIHGLDLGSLSRIRAALDSARRTGLITVLPQLEGTYAPALRGQMLVVQPTKALGFRDSADGIALTSVDVDSILATWADPGWLATELLLLRADGSHQSLRQNGSNPIFTHARRTLNRPVLVYGEVFLIRASPGPAFLRSQRSLASLGTALSGTLLTLMLGAVVGLVVRRRESLERAVQERTLALQEFRSALEQTDDGVALADFTGNIRFTNRAWARMHGYQPDELQTATISTFHTPEQMREEVREQLERVMRGDADTSEIPHLHRDGHTFPTRMSASLIRNASGEAFAIVGIARDISEEVKRRKRDRFEQRFRTLVAEIAARLVSTGDDESLDQALREGLAALGALFKVDRSYLFRFAADQGTMNNVHEWCAEGVTPFIDDMQSVPTNELRWWLTKMQEKRPLPIEDVAALPPEAAAEKSLFVQQGIQSLLCLPILSATRQLIGFIGFDSVRSVRSWPPDQIRMLQVIADIVAASLSRRDAVHALAESEARYRDLAKESGSFRWAVDMAGLYTEVDSLVTQVLGYRPEELVGKKYFYDLAPEPDREEIRRDGLKYLQLGLRNSAYINRAVAKDGRILWLSTTTLPLRDSQGALIGATGLDTDISARKQAELQLQHLAHHDLLTNLPNRALLADRLQQAMRLADRRKEVLGVACVDLDAFKPINDRFGHEVGDHILVTVAQRMRTALRESDTVARLGGDEFAIVLTGLDRIESSEPLLQRLLDTVAAPIEVQGNILSISVSLGMAFYPQSEDIDADQLLRQADQAMYQAKLAGKNRFQFFDEAHDRRLRDNHRQLERIKQGLESEEFVLHYQPKVDMKKGCLIGVEALIRWQHPERGLLPPSEFLPLLQKHKLMLDLGDWVLESVLRQITRWRESGISIKASLNVDPLQLAQPDFIDHLTQMLARYPQARPGDLELEVLETSALDETVPMVDIIQQGAKLGVTFSLDDFGTGYSSLAYLKRLPVTMLKIDGSFVRDMLSDPDDLAILQGVISLARTFRQTVIAEGVETEAHGKMLLRLGCELGQGYAIARPMPVDQLEKWASMWSPPASWQHTDAVDERRLPLLVAIVEYRVWSDGLLRSLSTGVASVIARINPAHDLIDRLNRSAVLMRSSGRYLQLDADLKVLGKELLNLAQAGSSASALQRFAEIEALKDELIKLLTNELDN